MTRFALRSATLAVAMLTVSTLTAAQRPAAGTIPVGKKFEGSLTGPSLQLQQILSRVSKPQATGLGFGGFSKFEGDEKLRDVGLTVLSTFYGNAQRVSLKAKQTISISATVAGTDRKVGIILLDPTGAILGVAGLESRANSLSVEELSATGTYGVVVLSNLIGPYTLKVTDGEEPSEQGLEERIKALERELEQLKAKLRELKAKKP